jgi:UDP-N-acetyl-D-galactosamine dehydrogenase
VGHEPEVILAGRRINDGMGDYFAERIAETGGKAAGGAPRTLVLGLTFKENLPDLRNSKVIDLIRGLEVRGHRVSVHDAHADPAEARAMYGLSLLTDLPKRNGGARFDVVVAAVPHEAYRAFTAEDIGRLLDAKGLVADIKGIWRELALPEGVRRWQP